MGRNNKEKEYLNIIVETFKTYEVDWLNYKITKENPLQYHHIVFSCEGGITSIGNGAPLTESSHCYFHKISQNDHVTARQITRTFKDLNATMLPPTEEYFEKIAYYLEKYEKKRIRIYVK